MHPMHPMKAVNVRMRYVCACVRRYMGSCLGVEVLEEGLKLNS